MHVNTWHSVTSALCLTYPQPWSCRPSDTLFVAHPLHWSSEKGSSVLILYLWIRGDELHGNQKQVKNQGQWAPGVHSRSLTFEMMNRLRVGGIWQVSQRSLLASSISAEPLLRNTIFYERHDRGNWQQFNVNYILENSTVSPLHFVGLGNYVMRVFLFLRILIHIEVLWGKETNLL